MLKRLMRVDAITIADSTFLRGRTPFNRSKPAVSQRLATIVLNNLRSIPQRTRARTHPS
jgi:hypothetical protein